jgi:hypothetical protein
MPVDIKAQLKAAAVDKWGDDYCGPVPDNKKD